MKDPGKEYDGFTITITGDRYRSGWMDGCQVLKIQCAIGMKTR